jgi:Flp pilus assembly protein TadG
MWTAFLVRLARLRRDCAGAAALEMAFVAPVIILLALAGVDTTRYVIATEQISKVANTIGQMLTENATGNVNYVDLQFYHDSAMVIYPDVLTDAAARNTAWSNDISISMASIQFTATTKNCGTTCTYKPKVIWTGGSNPRTCGAVFTSVPDASVPSATTLPQDIYGPGSVVVVDIQYNYHPWFASYLGASLGIARSVYLAPRYVSLISYQTVAGDNGFAVSCP